MAKAKPVKPDDKPPVIKDHVVEIIEAGEEWDKANELWCRLKQARCSGCGAVAKPARTAKTALKHFEREYAYREICQGVTRQLALDLTGGAPC